MIKQIASNSDPNLTYEIDTIKKTCSCKGFFYRQICTHVKKEFNLD